MRLPRSRALFASTGSASIVALIAAGLLLFGQGNAEPDLSYLENFRLAPSVQQQLTDARARGIDGQIHIPGIQLPPAWLKPELHGPFLLEPQGWIGELPPGSEDRPFTTLSSTRPPIPPTEADIRASTLWREPSHVPRGYTLRDVASEHPGIGITQHWSKPIAGQANAEEVLELQWWSPVSLPIRIGTWADGDARLFDPTTIDGYPAVTYRAIAHAGSTVWVFNEDEGVVYVGQSGSLAPDELMEIVRSLYR